MQTVITYVVLKLVDHLLQDRLYGGFINHLLSKEDYAERLQNIIFATIKTYEKKYPPASGSRKQPFYKSEILFEELNQCFFFDREDVSYQEVCRKFQESPRFAVPSQEELEEFYDILFLNIQEDTELKQLFIQENYQEKIFEIAKELSEQQKEISGIRQQLTRIEEQTTFRFTDEWFDEQCRSSIWDLGKRYTPELNFKLPVAILFEGIGKTYQLREWVFEKNEKIFSLGKWIAEQHIVQPAGDIMDGFCTILAELRKQLLAINSPGSNIVCKELYALYDILKTQVTYLGRCCNSELEEAKQKKDKLAIQKIEQKKQQCVELLLEVDDFMYDYFEQSYLFQLVSNPYLLLEGEAGIGKSHLIADVVSERMKRGYKSVFLLGQHLVSDEDPWIQILRRLELRLTSDEFLSALNQEARRCGHRIIIFVDALNEGRGKYFWPDNIVSFVNKIRKYNHLGLVLSVRTPYDEIIFPDNLDEQLNLLKESLTGFDFEELDAVRMFFENYEIELPAIPHMYPEFQNPLYLKLFCESIRKAGLNHIPDGLQGITSVIDFYLKNVNTRLADIKRLHYSPGLKLVKRVVDAFLDYRLTNNLYYVPYEKAVEIAETEVTRFVTKKGIFLDELIAEGIFYKNLYSLPGGGFEDGITLLYERFDDIFTGQWLLDKYPDHKEAFKRGGPFYQYIKDDITDEHQGLVEAFSILLPERTGKELYQ